MALPVAVAWSGGKDSAWMLHRLRNDARWDVRALLTSVDEDDGHVAVHRIPADVLRLQADAARLSLIEMPLPAQPSNAIYAQRFAAALRALRRCEPALQHLAFGDLFLADIRAWRESLCAVHGIAPIFPLWANDTARLAREMIDGGLKATLCCVDTTQLDAAFAGAAFDRALFDRLPTDVDPCGERGEFHTCVSAGPMFEESIALAPGMPMLREERFMYCVPEALR